MILPPIFGAMQSVRSGLEKRYIASYLALTGMYNTSSKNDVKKNKVQYSVGFSYSFLKLFLDFVLLHNLSIF